MRAKVDQPLDASLPSVYVAAHELKAPLILMRQLVLELQSNDKENRETIERLILSVERSLRLVEQLTRTSRLDDTLFETEPLHASVLCDVVAHELAPFARASNQHIRTRVSRRSGMVVGHRSLLVALLVNLCDNALQHSPRGKDVVISAHSRKDGVVFSVRDFGPSMSHRHFRALRDKLGDGPLPVGDRPRSSGLGLWIASQFAEAMGGQLTMTRHNSAGISVSVLMPHSNQLSLL